MDWHLWFVSAHLCVFVHFGQSLELGMFGELIRQNKNVNVQTYIYIYTYMCVCVCDKKLMYATIIEK